MEPRVIKTRDMKKAAIPTLLTLLALPAAAHANNWRPAEQIKPYTVRGSTGMELYQSIGARGPEAGSGQAIAYTTFKLTWRRDYRPLPDGACVLASARPNLTIIYSWPKPATKLSGAMADSWQTFIRGVETHERVHGEHILDMVQKIEAYSVGLRAENDPKCQKVREVLQKRLGELSNEQRRRSSDFDREEMSPGGRVHQLILALVNGP
jgi:predicted secreted Zn-dependent protease